MNPNEEKRQAAEWLAANWPGEWAEHPEYKGLHELKIGDTLLAWIQQRPAYCDRGHWQGQLEFSPGNPLDSGDGGIQHYMRLGVAKRDLEEKLRWRVMGERSPGENVDPVRWIQRPGAEEKSGIFMVVQNYEVGRADFGSALVDRIAFEICSTMQVLCGSKSAMLDLIYSAAGSILQHCNAAGVTWTPIKSHKPDAIDLYVLYRWRSAETGPWTVGYAAWKSSEDPSDDPLEYGRWSRSSGHRDWPDGSEWMALPIQ